MTTTSLSRRALLPVVLFVALGLVAIVLPLLIATPHLSSAATARHVVHRDGFERSLAQWKRTGKATRLDRVSRGHAGSKHAARLRPPSGRTATVGLTDAPSLVRSTSRGNRYLGSVWVRASAKAVRGGALTVRLGVRAKTAHGGATAWRRVRLTHGSWQQITVPVTSRQDRQGLDFTVRALHLRAGGALLVDDARVSRIPRPSLSKRQGGPTRYGAAVDPGKLDWNRALHLSDQHYTRMQIVRVYEPFIRDSWHGVLAGINRPVTVSFKAPPRLVISGAYDAELRTWFRNAPNHRPTWWTYWHEPEDDIEHGVIQADRYRAAWRHINQIAQQAGTKALHPTLILMCWTADSRSGRVVKRYYPGSFIDVMAWDCYNPPGWMRYASPKALMGPAAHASHIRGNRFAVAELGSVLVPGDEGSRRATWLVDCARYAARHRAAFVSYWDSKIPNENYQLHDVPSRLAWRSAVSS